MAADMTNASSSSPPNKHFPKDGLVIISMMRDLGISSYESRVVNQLLEFTYRYVSSVLDDARAFATHSQRRTIDNEDIKLAVMMQLERNFTTPPPRDLLLEVARTKNSVPLPLVKPHCGIRLPPDRYCFSSCNYKLRSSLLSSSSLALSKPKFTLSSSSSLSSSGLGKSIKVSKQQPPPGFSASGAGGATASVPGTGLTLKRPPSLSHKSGKWLDSASSKDIKGSSGSYITSVGGGMSTPTILTGKPLAHQVAVRIEPQDSLVAAGKRKREDGD